MARGHELPVGTERTSPNGYVYRKLEDGRWELLHRIIVEERLGRPLEENEYVTFIDGNRTNFDPANLALQVRGRSSLTRRLAQLNSRIDELTAARDDVVRRMQTRDAL